MRRKILFGFIALLLALGFSNSIVAQPGQWTKLGSAHVNGTARRTTPLWFTMANPSAPSRSAWKAVLCTADHIIVRYGKWSA